MMQWVIVALNQNAVKTFFGLKVRAISYFIGKSFHLLYTRRKEHSRIWRTRSFEMFMLFAIFQMNEQDIRRIYVCSLGIVLFKTHAR